MYLQFQNNKQKNLEEKTFFVGNWCKEQNPDPEPIQIRGTVEQIPNTKMSRICNTALKI
jgi:hypothetical protein